MISRKKLKLSEILNIIGAFAFFIGFMAKQQIFWIIGAVLVAAGLVLFFRTCRCPHCGKMILGGLSSNSESAECGFCGKPIELKD